MMIGNSRSFLSGVSVQACAFYLGTVMAYIGPINGIVCNSNSSLGCSPVEEFTMSIISIIGVAILSGFACSFVRCNDSKSFIGRVSVQDCKAGASFVGTVMAFIGPLNGIMCNSITSLDCSAGEELTTSIISTIGITILFRLSLYFVRSNDLSQHSYTPIP